MAHELDRRMYARRVRSRCGLRAAVKEIDCFGAVRANVNCVTFIRQMLAQRIAHRLFIINYQNSNVLVLCFGHEY